MSTTNSSPVMVELKPNRDLLDPNFNGYKLSLEKLPNYVVSIKTGVDRPKPSEQQYSLQHVKQFAIHNHIFSDPFNPFVVYIVDKVWTILRVSIDLVVSKILKPCWTERLYIISEVWRIPKASGKKEGRFNVTLSFPDNGHAVVSNGCNTLYILKTGDRKLSEPWNPIMTSNPFSEKASPQFSILDSTKYKIGSNAFIDVLALRIDEKAEWSETLENLPDSNLQKHSFLTVLEWFTFQGEGSEETKWTLSAQRSLLGHAGLEYAYIESEGGGLVLASESKFYMVADTGKPINLKANVSGGENSDEANKPEYVWTQTMDEVKLWFKVPYTISKRDADIEFKRNSLNVNYKGRPVLEGPLAKPIKVEGSYWIIDTPKCLPEDAPEIQETDEGTDPKKYKVLEIVLEKEDQGVVWVDEVIKGNSNGQQVSDPEFVADIHSRLAHLCSDKWGADPGQSDAYDPRQLEECDEYPAHSSCLMRIDKSLQRISHTASLGSHQWLFNVRVEAGKLPAICIRHDVDGVIWRPVLLSQAEESSTRNWNCEHFGTFSALGYVQASKQQRKYTSCSPDISYVAICDVKKHIYVYRQPTKIESCLRNRRTGEQVTHVAKQLVISLDPPEDILGSFATPSYLYVLTPENFHAIRILAEEE